MPKIENVGDENQLFRRFLLAEGFPIVAVDYLVACAVPVMHSVSKAEIESFALFAYSFFGPLAVSELLKPVVPNFEKVVGVDASLRKTVTVNVWASADAAVNQN